MCAFEIDVGEKSIESVSKSHGQNSSSSYLKSGAGSENLGSKNQPSPPGWAQSKQRRPKDIGQS